MVQDSSGNKMMIDQFRLLKQIGSGGQGDAWHAINTEDN